jgi:hypothetical protein
VIIRSARFVIRPRLEAEFIAHARTTVKNAMGKVDGLLDIEIGVRVEGGRSIFAGISRWRDMDALRSFVGDDLEVPLLWDPNSEWIESATIEHYEDIRDSPA